MIKITEASMNGRRDADARRIETDRLTTRKFCVKLKEKKIFPVKNLSRKSENLFVELNLFVARKMKFVVGFVRDAKIISNDEFHLNEKEKVEKNNKISRDARKDFQSVFGVGAEKNENLFAGR